MSNINKIKTIKRKLQFGGMLSGLASGVTGTLFGQGLPNSDYNYQNTGHRSTSYDGLTYIPKAVEPNIMPQLLDAYNSQYKVKDFYDPKVKLDTGDFEKNLEMYQIDKDMWMNEKMKANKEIEDYILLNRGDKAKMDMLPMYIEGIKDKLTKGTAGRISTFKENTELVKDYAKQGLSGDDHQFFDGKNPLYKRNYVNEKGEAKTMLAFEDEIYNKFGSLKGWKTGGMKSYHVNAEYLTPETAERSKRMEGENTTFNKAKEMVDGYLKDGSKNSLKYAWANSGLNEHLQGYNSNTLVFKNSSGSQLNEDNFKQIESGIRSITESLDPKIILGLKRNFNYNLNRNASIIQRYDKDTEVTEEVTNENGKQEMQKVTKKKGDVMKDEKGGLIIKTQNLSEVSQAEKETAFQMYVSGFIKDRADFFSGKTQSQEAQASTFAVNHNHGDGSGALDNKKYEAQVINDVTALNDGKIKRDSKTAGGDLWGGLLGQIFPDQVIFEKPTGEKSLATGASLTNDRLYNASIIAGSLRNPDDSPITIEDSEGKSIEGQGAETRLKRLNQQMYQGKEFVNAYGEKLTKQEYEEQIKAGGIVEARNSNTMLVYGTKEEGVTTQEKGNIELTGKNAKTLTKDSPQYREIAEIEVRNAEAAYGKEYAKTLSKKYQDGKIKITYGVVKGTAKNRFAGTQGGSGESKQDNKTEDAFKSKNPNGEKGMKLMQQGGVIDNSYFQKTHLPDIKLEDLF